jgi:hypothetical protein
VNEEHNDTEPGPGTGDILCRCGCDQAALYLVDSEDIEGPFKGEPCCTTSMLYLKDAAAELGFPFKATRFPKPLPHTCKTEWYTCDACVYEMLRRAKESGRSPA